MNTNTKPNIQEQNKAVFSEFVTQVQHVFPKNSGDNNLFDTQLGQLFEVLSGTMLIGQSMK